MKQSLVKRMLTLFACASLLASSAALVACSQEKAADQASKTQSSQPAEKVELHLQAAASLKYSFDEIIPLWNASHPNVTITGNFDASGTLAEQIKQGAPADIFISANQSKMNDVEKDGKVKEGTRTDLLENELVLIVPADSKLNISSIKDLTAAEVKHVAVGEPSAVPAGKYAQQSFESAGIADALAAKAVQGKDVTQVLTTVVSGNADAGLVYKTDALTQKDTVKIVGAVDGHDKVIYPAAELSTSKNPEIAHEFLEFLKTKEVAQIFEKYGFKLAV